MLRLFGLIVRLAFGLQIAIILMVAMSIALINEVASGDPAGRPAARHRIRQARRWKFRHGAPAPSR
jgi:hypothetical protein